MFLIHTDPSRGQVRYALPAGARLGALAAVLLALVAAAPAVATAADVPGHGRAWELVTPPDRNGAGLASVRGVDAGGDRVVYATNGPAAGAPAGTVLSDSYNFATREQGGWTAHPVGYPYTSTSVLALGSVVMAGASADLSTWVWSSLFPLLPGAPGDPHIALYRSTGSEPGGPLTLLSDAGTLGYGFNGMSGDGRHVVFSTGDRLLPADVPRTSGNALYELDGETLRLVSVNGGGAPLSSCGAGFGGAYSGSPLSRTLNGVSRDGTRIFMTAPQANCAGALRRVYLREDAATTTDVSVSHCTRPNCNTPKNVAFAGATPSGSTAFMITTQQLTDDDTDESSDLYRYEVAGGSLTRVSAGPPGVGANVVSKAVAVSADGTRVYFLASGQLVPGEGVAGTKLYLSDQGVLKFVANLKTNDPLVSGTSAPTEMTSDGDRLLFTSGGVNGDDADATLDAYLYDASSAALTRLSTGSSGGNGAFDVDIRTNGTPMVGIAPRALSVDGRRAFFKTSEALVPEDVNGTIDVYEWFDGSVALVSSGKGNDQLLFGGASGDGSTVFFATNESLLAADRDGGDLDLYAARLDGGFPDPPQPPPPSCDDLGTCPPPAARRLSPKVPDSASRGPDEPALRVAEIGSLARRHAVATGRLALLVDVAARGRVTVRARARLGGRPRTVARAGADARRAGQVRVVLTLSRPARRVLKRGGRLRLTLAVSQPRLGAKRTLTVRLGGAR